MKILVVDDAAEKAGQVVELLKPVVGNVQIDVAKSGLAAREHLARTRYDLLVLDIKLPLREDEEPDKRGGLNLLSEITISNRFLSPAHVVALTGYEDLRKEFEEKYNNGQWAIETYDPADIGWRERLRAKAIYISKTIQQAGQSYATDLGIVVALGSPELDAIRSLDWGWSEPEMLDPVSFLYRGSYRCEGQDKTVVATAAPRMGMVAAATLTQKLVHHLRPRMLAMPGICAGVRGEVELGDVILADPSWDWQMGKYRQENLEIAPDQIPAPLEVSQRMSILRGDRQLFIELSEAFKGDKPNHVSTLRLGPVASGSAVLADDATLEIIKKQHRKVLGVEMEIYGVVSSVRDSCVPRPLAFGLKGVCDFADHLKNDKYQKYAAYMSAQTLRAFVERYSNQLSSQTSVGTREAAGSR